MNKIVKLILIYVVAIVAFCIGAILLFQSVSLKSFIAILLIALALSVDNRIYTMLSTLIHEKKLH